MGRSQKIRATGELIGDAFAGVVDTVAEVHQAIARRTFAALRPAATPVRLLHDEITSGVYRVVRSAHALPRAISVVAAAGAGLFDHVPLPANRPAGLAIALVNGWVGADLGRRHPALALGMTLHSESAELTLTPDGLAAAFPLATSRIVVFVHGWCETEQYWWLSSRRHYGTERSTHGSRLERDLGYTAVYLRYNSGLHVSDNGARLARLLEELVAGWPVAVTEVALIGHSMGGLIARSACRQADAGGYTCAPHIRHVLCLATPNLGAPLEKAANAAAWLLAAFPETRPLSRLANLRSDGVKDLRYGALVEDDWREFDPDELLRDRCTNPPLLPYVTYYFIGTTVTARHEHPLARVVGDGFVRFPSASGNGRRRRISFAQDNGHYLGGLHHFDLLNHPDVYHQIHTWLARTGEAEGVTSTMDFSQRNDSAVGVAPT
jgi:pimeloyl-ACP methyl ester carboxylesterase